ncbi:MAG TPA: nuclear transport factor 2 family protein [Polyangiaceae bacterium]|nr:nuclear transport factor 2 family protein [Polyangiaceae bacterium]
MPRLRECVQAFVRLLNAGKGLQAMERFYHAEVVVFENRTLARAGRDACMEHERQQLALQPSPLSFRLLKSAVDPQSGAAFLEYVLRFQAPDGRRLRLEQVAVQRWSEGKIVEERFYYEGFVDESDEPEAAAPLRQ